MSRQVAKMVLRVMALGIRNLKKALLIDKREFIFSQNTSRYRIATSVDITDNGRIINIHFNKYISKTNNLVISGQTGRMLVDTLETTEDGFSMVTSRTYREDKAPRLRYLWHDLCRGMEE